MTKTTKRRFFQSKAHWDEEIERVLVGSLAGSMGQMQMPKSMSLAALMASGGRLGEDPVGDDGMAVDDEWDGDDAGPGRVDMLQS